MKTDQNNIEEIKIFFNNYSASFDSIYSNDLKNRNIFNRSIDKYFRKSMFNRFQLTFEYIEKNQIKSLIDIGCGSGIYSNFLAKKKYSVLGIDIADEMISLAIKNSIISKNLKYEVAEYSNFNIGKKFDAAILMGFFDYIEYPNIIFDKLKSDIDKLILASFPKNNGILAWQRRLRYKMKKCPLFLYNYEQINNLLSNRFSNFYIIDNHREYFAVVYK